MTKRPATVIDKSDSQWHLDRKVPIALILSIFLQTGGIVWWGATTNARINSLEEKASGFAAQVATQPERLAKVETKLESVQDGIAEIKSILRREPSPLKSR